jgi:hypothetical protein
MGDNRGQPRLPFGEIPFVHHGRPVDHSPQQRDLRALNVSPPKIRHDQPRSNPTNYNYDIEGNASNSYPQETPDDIFFGGLRNNAPRK